MHVDPTPPVPDSDALKQGWPEAKAVEAGVKAGVPVAITTPIEDNRPWYRMLNGYQWFVFIVWCLAWDMDCMDQQLFNLARRPAMVDLVPKVKPDDATLVGAIEAALKK